MYLSVNKAVHSAHLNLWDHGVDVRIWSGCACMHVHTHVQNTLACYVCLDALVPQTMARDLPAAWADSENHIHVSIETCAHMHI